MEYMNFTEKGLITHVIPLEMTAEAFELAADKSQGMMKIIVKP